MSPTKLYLESAFLLFALFGGAVLSVVSTDFGASGGANIYNLVLCALCSFAFIYLTIRNTEDKGRIHFPAPLLWALGLLSITILITDGTGWYLHSSLVSTLEWFMALGLFIGTAAWISHNPNAARIFLGLYVFTTAAFSIYGFYTFTLDLTSLHVRSILGEYNAFGGFLLIPFFLSLALAFTANSSRARLIYSSSTVLISAALLLTFSPSTYIALLFGLILGGVFLRKDLFSIKRSVLLKMGILILCSVIFAYGWYSFTQSLGKIEHSTLAPHISVAIPPDTFSDRVEYLTEASHIFIANPFGIGLGNYSLGAQTYRTDVLHFALNSHNAYVQMFVEAGFLGGIFFLIFILYAFFRPAYKAYLDSRSGTSSEITLGLIIGIGATLIHVGIDVDLAYPITFFSLFIFLGILWGTTPGLLTTNGLKTSSSSLPRLCAGMIGIITLLLLAEFMSFLSLEKGDILDSKQQSNAALAAYQDSLLFDPLNADTYIKEAQEYNSLAIVASSTAQHQHYLQSTLSSLQNALNLNSHNPIAYLYESQNYQAEGNLKQAIAVQKKSLTSSPLDNLDNYLHLVQLDLFIRDNISAITTVDTITEHFPPSVFSDPTIVISSKEESINDLVQLTELAAAAYAILGNTAGSNIELTKEKEYASLQTQY